MRIQSSFTLEELVESQERVLARSSVARSWQYDTAVMNAFVGGVTAYILVVVVAGRSFIVGLILSIIAAIAGAALSWNWYRIKVRRQLHDYYREQLGEKDSFPIQLKFTESGIWAEQLGTQIKFEWSSVEEIEEIEDSIDFYMRNGGGIFVKKKDFSSLEEQKQFMDAAQQYLNKSRTSSNWLHAS